MSIALWSDWCTATHLDPSSATAESLAAFFSDVPAAPATRRRRVRALVAGGVRVDVPRAEPPPDGRALAAIPRWGWPSGLNGRRDAAIVALRTSGFTTARLRTLTTDAVRPVGDLWQVSGTILPVADERDFCAACAVAGWLLVLGMALDGRAEVQKYLVVPSDEHWCREAIGDRWHRAAQLWPAIDRYGWLDDTRPISARAITAAARCRPQSGSAPEPTAVRTPEEPRSTDWDALLSDLESGVDAITARVNRVMAAVQGNRSNQTTTLSR